MFESWHFLTMKRYVIEWLFLLTNIHTCITIELIAIMHNVAIKVTKFCIVWLLANTQ